MAMKIYLCSKMFVVNYDEGPIFYDRLCSIRAPTKVLVFGWLMLQWTLATQAVISHRILKWLGPSQCGICGGANKTIDHLFLSCTTSEGLWSYVRSTLMVRGRSNSIVQPWTSKDIPSLTGGTRHTWDMVFLCICWYNWRKRNTQVFRDTSSDLENLQNLCWFLLREWVMRLGEKNQALVEAPLLNIV